MRPASDRGRSGPNGRRARDARRPFARHGRQRTRGLASSGPRLAIDSPVRVQLSPSARILSSLAPAIAAALSRTAADSTLLSAWGQLWTYITLGATAIVTEEAAPLLGGALAEEGHLGAVRVAVAIATGTQAAHIGLYFLGRWRWSWVRRKLPKRGRVLTRAVLIVRRRPWRASLAVRYAYGLRIALPIACGAARVRMHVFLIGSTISAVTWSALFTILGWMFGRSALALLRHLRAYDEFLALAALGIVGVGIFFLTRRTERAVVAEEAASAGARAEPSVAAEPSADVEQRRDAPSSP